MDYPSQAEQALNQLRQAVQNSGEVIFLTDRDGLITYVNPEFTRLYGYAPDEVVNRTTPRVLKSGLMKQENYEAFWKTLLSRQLVKGELVNKTRDGGLITVEGTANAIIDENDEISGFLAIQRDITGRKEVESELKRRNEQLAVLRHISQVVTQSLDLDLVAKLTLEETNKALGLDAGLIRYVNEATNEIILLAHTGLPPNIAKGIESRRRLKVGEGLVGVIAQSGHPMVVEDLATESRSAARLVVPWGFQSFVGLPLKVKDRVVAVLSGFSRQKRTYAQFDMEMLISVGNIVGVAIENARVHSEMERLNISLQQTAQKRSAMNRITAAISSTLDLDTIYAALSSELPKLVQFDRLSVALRQDEIIESFAIWDDFQGRIGSRRTRPIADSVFSRVFTEGRPFIREDISGEDYRIDPEIVQAGALSAILVPLVSGRRTFGSLNLLSRRANAYSEADLDYLQPIADQLSVAMENARLFSLTDEKLQRRINELEALTEVLSASSRSLHLQTVLDTAISLTSKAMGTEKASIALVEDDGAKFRIAAACNWGEDPTHQPDQERMISEIYSWARIVETKEPYTVSDARDKKEYPGLEHARTLGLISIIVIPLIHDTGVIGTINLATSSYEKSFSTEEIKLVRAIASHLAALIENVRLHERTELERSTLNAIVACMGEGLVVADAKENIIYCNRAAEMLLGLDSRDVLNRPAGAFYGLLSGRVVEPKNWLANLRDQFRELEAQPRLQVTIQIPERKELETTCFVIKGQGQKLGTGAVLRDVTREREVDRMKTEFISMASHELRTPMTSILGFAELLLKSTELKNSEHRCAEWIYKESLRLNNIVDDLLNVSRIEMGRLSLNLSAVDLPPFVDKIVTVLKSRYPGAVFRTSFPHGLPRAQADPEKLEQVLYNLFDNAAKYSLAPGDIVISGHEETGAGSVVLAIADRGLGIPPEEIPRLFSRFHRICRPDAQTVRGTGLGLYIVRSLLEMMKGRVWVESKTGQGSTFYLSLPAAPKES